jgi:cathepsin D
MAYPELAEAGVTPVFDEMMNQKLLKSNVFAFYFTTQQQENSGMKSDMTFGYYDKQKFTGDITWHNVDYKYMFGVKLDDVKVGGKSLNMCEGKSCLITFDSGTSLMSFPTWGAQKLVENKIPTANNIVPCNNHAQFGDMTLVINGKDYVLSNEEWMFPSQELNMAQGGVSQQLNFNMGPLGPQLMAQVDHSEVDVDAKFEGFKLQTPAFPFQSFVQQEKVKHKTSKGVHACASTVMAMDISREMFLVGDIFMRKFYTIFDRDNDRVGLATAITSNSASVAALNQVDLAQKNQKKK